MVKIESGVLNCRDSTEVSCRLQVMIKHLREQLAKAQVEAEQVPVLKIRETGLRSQIENLQDQLRVARENLTPVSVPEVAVLIG